MHASSYENMQKCYERYLLPCLSSTREEVLVVEVGSADINGGYRDIFTDSRIRHLGVDLTAGIGVDVVATSPYHLPFTDAYADYVLSGQMLEHSEYFWLSFQEMLRILKPGGYLFLIAPSAGPIHRYPVDCYRFYPDAFEALAHLTNANLVDIWHDDRGPWKDLVGVFSKQPKPRWNPAARYAQSPQSTGARKVGKGTSIDLSSYLDRPDIDRISGAASYLDFLRTLHQELAPRNYLEIGVRNGNSLRLAQCPSIGVDPAPELGEQPPRSAKIFPTTSDEFFDFDAAEALPDGVDLALIDGMHWFEYALRDFINLERYSRPETLIIVDDIFPNHHVQALRSRKCRVWTGDVWKLHECLKTYRADLVLIPVDTSPTGSLLITNLDSNNRTLVEQYNPIVREFVSDTPLAPPPQVLERNGSFEPHDPRILQLLHLLRTARAPRDDITVIRKQLFRFRKELEE